MDESGNLFNDDVRTFEKPSFQEACERLEKEKQKAAKKAAKTRAEE